MQAWSFALPTARSSERIEFRRGNLARSAYYSLGVMTIGLVSKLWRYPVKSMLGEECHHVELDVRGLSGDRLFAIRDVNGKFGSGKNTRRFRDIDGLFAFHASYSADWPDITFPDGRRMRGDDPQIHDALSE